MPVRDQGHLVRHHFQHQGHEAVHGGIAFDVEFGLQKGTDFPYVGVADVALVRPGVYGDSLGPEDFAVQRGLRYVGDISAARIAQRCDFVDIYTQSSHVSVY